jgi:hypothetical protein
MKSQDILILLKLISLEQEEALRLKQLAIEKPEISSKLLENAWQGWEAETNTIREQVSVTFSEKYTSRGLSRLLGISKTEVNASIKRSILTGLAKLDRETARPKANITAIKKFIINGLKYVFPAKTGGITRGIPTSFAAPVLKGKLMTAGETIYVWPDPYGKSKGETVFPLHKGVPQAVRWDPKLYEFLALIDAVRLGLPREVKLAESILEEVLR